MSGWRDIQLLVEGVFLQHHLTTLTWLDMKTASFGISSRRPTLPTLLVKNETWKIPEGILEDPLKIDLPSMSEVPDPPDFDYSRSFMCLWNKLIPILTYFDQSTLWKWFGKFLWRGSLWKIYGGSVECPLNREITHFQLVLSHNTDIGHHLCETFCSDQVNRYYKPLLTLKFSSGQMGNDKMDGKCCSVSLGYSFSTSPAS